MASIGECPQFGQAVALERLECLPVMPPGAVDFASCACGTEDQIRIDTEQAVASADFAALDRFEEEIAAPLLDQLERCANRRLRVGNQLAPDECIFARLQAGTSFGSEFGCRSRSGEVRQADLPN